MNSNEIKQISKFLSFVLRHKPEEIGLVLNNEGWANVEELIGKMNQKNTTLTLFDLKEIVALNDKKRFIFSDDFSKIRASQGHSIAIDLKLEAVIPPEILYHGTAEKNRASIFEKGILKQDRNHVHLSADIETAKKVGMRYGKPVVLEVLATQMYQDGHVFFISENNVWLTDYVPTVFMKTL